LLVEDHPDGAATMAAVLGLAGHDVRVARTPAEALDALDAFPPDGVVLDVGLPGMDGYRLAGLLCARLGRRPLLVALTGYPRLADQSRDEGFDHHFEKPVDPAALLAALADCPPAPAPGCSPGHWPTPQSRPPARHQ
jgi:CheY-like chemotaxis protein